MTSTVSTVVGDASSLIPEVDMNMCSCSLDDLVLVDKKLAEKPIRLPDHPIMASLKDAGFDEFLAAGVDIGSTGIASLLLHGSTRLVVMPFIGPVVEKGIFYARHAYQANNVYKTTPEHLRQSRMFYFKEGVKHGSANMMKDICIHDPIYIGGMMGGLYLLPDVYPVFLSLGSYLLGIAGITAFDVTSNHLKMNRLKKELTGQGFYEETYWESRFFIRADKDPEIVTEMLSKEFGLEPKGTAMFNDVYMQNVLPVLNSRTGKLRFRSRGRREHEKGEGKWGPDDDAIHTLQVVYSRARRHLKKDEQFNYFPIQKSKICYMLDGMVSAIDELTDKNPRDIAKKYSAPDPRYRRVVFERALSCSDELAVCTDTVKAERPYYVLELKVYNNTDLLQQAMRYVMLECPVVAVPTTLAKGDLFV